MRRDAPDERDREQAPSVAADRGAAREECEESRVRRRRQGECEQTTSAIAERRRSGRRSTATRRR